MADEDYDMNEIGSPPADGSDLAGSDSVWVDEAFNRAFWRCVTESGIGEAANDSPEEIAETDAAVLAWTGCMRDRGWQVEDPVPGNWSDALDYPDVVNEDPDRLQAELEDTEACGLPVMWDSESGHGHGSLADDENHEIGDESVSS